MKNHILKLLIFIISMFCVGCSNNSNSSKTANNDKVESRKDKEPIVISEFEQQCLDRIKTKLTEDSKNNLIKDIKDDLFELGFEVGVEDVANTIGEMYSLDIDNVLSLGEDYSNKFITQLLKEPYFDYKSGWTYTLNEWISYSKDEDFKKRYYIHVERLSNQIYDFIIKHYYDHGNDNE